MLKRVPRKSETAVIVDSFGCRNAEEEDILSNREPHHHMSEKGAAGIENETFNGMIVESAERIGNVESMVPAVNGAVEIRHLMTRSMHHVLPSVENEPDIGENENCER
jgi:hypothetical protein